MPKSKIKKAVSDDYRSVFLIESIAGFKRTDHINIRLWLKSGEKTVLSYKSDRSCARNFDALMSQVELIDKGEE